jgi:hypothetical protein
MAIGVAGLKNVSRTLFLSMRAPWREAEGEA